MTIQSVTSGLSTYLTGGSPVSQPQQTSQSDQTQSAQTTQSARATERTEPRSEERVERREESPRPVINAQGQKTGTLINTSA